MLRQPSCIRVVSGGRCYLLNSKKRERLARSGRVSALARGGGTPMLSIIAAARRPSRGV